MRRHLHRSGYNGTADSPDGLAPANSGLRSVMTAQPPPDDAAPEGATKHTAIGVGLNLLLLAMIGFGYWRSEDWKWAWVLVGIPIAVVTLRYAWHLLRSA